MGGKPLPERIEVNGCRYARRRVFKNDFFAITALYEGDGGRVILKVQRQASFLLIPLGWASRILAAKEESALKRLGDLEGIPKMFGRWGKTGIVREYVEGKPLARGERVPDDFHERLRSLIASIHERKMAYVDLEKCENVLVGDDGKPRKELFTEDDLHNSDECYDLWASILKPVLKEAEAAYRADRETE